MKRFLPTFLLIMVVLAIYPFVGNDDAPKKLITGLPWQIEKRPDGSTRVFGIVLGESSLSDAVDTLGPETELAVMLDKDGRSSLEMYYGGYRAGLLSGKLVLLGEMDDDTLVGIRDNASSKEVMESTARKFIVEKNDYAIVYRARVKHIAFIPAVNLDEDIIIKRFGEAAETLQTHTGVKHFLYPELGLDIALSDGGKEVLQYVAPADFDKLTAPLHAADRSDQAAP